MKKGERRESKVKGNSREMKRRIYKKEKGERNMIVAWRGEERKVK